MPNPDSDRAAAMLDALPSSGCTCMTKTPEIRYHREDCDYRRFVETFLASKVAPIEAASLKNVSQSSSE